MENYRLLQHRLWKLLAPFAEAEFSSEIPAAAEQEVIQLLTGLVGAPIEVRKNLFSLLPCILHSRKKTLRDAAIQLLTDTHGLLPMRWIADALNTSSYQTAVKTLAQCSVLNPDLAALAVFHRDISVRREWLSHRQQLAWNSNCTNAELAVYSLADTDKTNRSLAASRFMDYEECFSGHTLILLLKLHGAFKISDEDFTSSCDCFLRSFCGIPSQFLKAFWAAWKLNAITAHDLLQATWLLNLGTSADDVVPKFQGWLLTNLCRPSEDLSDTQISFSETLLHKHGVDSLKHLSRQPETPGMEILRTLLWHNSASFEQFSCEAEEEHLQIAGCFLITAVKTGVWNEAAALHTVYRIPELFATSVLPADLCDLLCERLVDEHRQIIIGRRRIKTLLNRLARSTKESGQVNLRITAALMTLLKDRRFEAALSKTGREKICESAETNPLAAAWFFTTPDCAAGDEQRKTLFKSLSRACRLKLITAICEQSDHNRTDTTRTDPRTDVILGLLAQFAVSSDAILPQMLKTTLLAGISAGTKCVNILAMLSSGKCPDAALADAVAELPDDAAWNLVRLRSELSSTLRNQALGSRKRKRIDASLQELMRAAQIQILTSESCKAEMQRIQPASETGPDITEDSEICCVPALPRTDNTDAATPEHASNQQPSAVIGTFAPDDPEWRTERPDAEIDADLERQLAECPEKLTLNTLVTLGNQGVQQVIPAIAQRLDTDSAPNSLQRGRLQQAVFGLLTTQSLCLPADNARDVLPHLRALCCERDISVEEADWIASQLNQYLIYSSDEAERQIAAELLARISRFASRDSSATNRLYSTIDWGVDVARKLMDKPIQIHLIGDDNLGNMQPGIPAINISPLPILEQELHGEDVVKGLILHELGHHLFHATDKYRERSQQALQENLQCVWNIVLDEHLERRLRSLDAEYGRKLQRLNAWAFLHRRKPCSIEYLLQITGVNAFQALTATTMSPARNSGYVLVSPGALLAALDQAGTPFARFFRCLRLGKGNRSDHPKVKAALDLFRGDFRNAEADRLYEVTYRIHEIFGDDCLNMAELLATADEDDLVASDSLIQQAANGVNSDSVNAHIRRNTLSRQTHVPPPETHNTDRSVTHSINVSATEEFATIDHIVSLPYCREEHQELSRRVATESHILRSFLTDLGRNTATTLRRTSGSSIDQRQLAPMLICQDPRVLKKRELEATNDLFLSIVVDCSGSMAGEEINQARLFATLMCDACRHLSGVDVRVFGFTDQIIYDAGNANSCAAHALDAGGGNNDAAGLHHAANAALQSGRRTRVVVMISDGLPTECSVSALRGLVRKLTSRYGIICAQVATTPLSEICFPNYIELSDHGTMSAVKHFGRILRDLILKAQN